MSQIISKEKPLDGSAVITASITALVLLLALILFTELGAAEYAMTRFGIYSLQLVGVGFLLLYTLGVRAEIVDPIPEEKQRSYATRIAAVVLVMVALLGAVFLL